MSVLEITTVSGGQFRVTEKGSGEVEIEKLKSGPRDKMHNGQVIKGAYTVIQKGGVMKLFDSSKTCIFMTGLVAEVVEV